MTDKEPLPAPLEEGEPLIHIVCPQCNGDGIVPKPVPAPEGGDAEAVAYGHGATGTNPVLHPPPAPSQSVERVPITVVPSSFGDSSYSTPRRCTLCWGEEHGSMSCEAARPQETPEAAALCACGKPEDHPAHRNCPECSDMPLPASTGTSEGEE